MVKERKDIAVAVAVNMRNITAQTPYNAALPARVGSIALTLRLLPMRPKSRGQKPYVLQPSTWIASSLNDATVIVIHERGRGRVG